MCGAIAGALHGVDGIKADWASRAQQVSSVDQRDLAARLAQTALAKYHREAVARRLFDQLCGEP